MTMRRLRSISTYRPTTPAVEIRDPDQYAAQCKAWGEAWDARKRELDLHFSEDHPMTPAPARCGLCRTSARTGDL